MDLSYILIPPTGTFSHTHFALYYTDIRRSHAIRNREPWPFLDVVGPVAITAILMACIVVQFIVKANELYTQIQ
jgi:hypothetical protein